MPCVAYGDAQTCSELRGGVEKLAEALGLKPTVWKEDVEGLRGVTLPGDAVGLVSALGLCIQHSWPLLVPLPQDMPSEQHQRLVSHLLNERGLVMYFGALLVQWDLPRDPLDQALRYELDAAADLAAAVTGRRTHLDVEFLIGDWTAPDSVVESRVIAELSHRRHLAVPGEPDPARGWDVHQARSVASFADWLLQERDIEFARSVLNDLGVRKPSGRPWSRSALAALLRERRESTTRETGAALVQAR
jgi:hypothetical protein